MQQFSFFNEQPHSEIFTVKFDGNNSLLREHKINASDYLVSLGGYSKFLTYITKELFNQDIEVAIVADQDGSFKSVLRATLTTFTIVTGSFSGFTFFDIDSNDASNFLSNVQKTIVKEIKNARGNIQVFLEKIQKSLELSDEDKLRLIKLMKDHEFRESLDDFTKPLDKNDYDKITVLKDNESFISIETSERPYFRYVSPPEETTEDFQDMVEIIYLSPELTKWEFRGKTNFWADVLDTGFIEKTKNRKSSDLRGLKFFASGRIITRKKEGSKRKTITWEIDMISDVPVEGTLPLK